MSDETDAQAARLAVLVLRSLKRWDQRELAQASGLDQRDISRYETGERVPRPQTLLRLAAVAGVSPARLGLLIDVLRQTVADLSASRPLPSPNQHAEPAADRDQVEELAREVLEVLGDTFRSTLATLFEVEEREPQPLSPAQARAKAERAWQRFQELPEEHHRFVIQHGKEYQTWAFCERLCAASAKKAGDRQAARNLAELAVYAAEQPAGSPGLRRRLQGYAWGFVGLARQRFDDLRETEEAFERARHLWASGEASGFEPLDENRWLSLSAGLRPN